MSKENDLRVPWPFPDFEKPVPGFAIRSSFIVPLVGTFSKLLFGLLSKSEVHNAENFYKLFQSQNEVSFITVSNHFSCLDDPISFGFMKWRDLCNSKLMRWSPAAHDICFTNRIYSWFFSSGKCVPVIRGAGVYQRGMDFCIQQLNKGGWVHIFPEAKVNLTHENLRFKWGIGRLVYECKRTPIVLPFYHIGFDSLLPNRTPYIPRLRKMITVVFGDPIDLRDMVNSLRKNGADDMEARKVITDYIQDKLYRLKPVAEKLHSLRHS